MARAAYDIPYSWEENLTKCRALMDVLELCPELAMDLKDGLSDHLERLLNKEREDFARLPPPAAPPWPSTGPLSPNSHARRSGPIPVTCDVRGGLSPCGVASLRWVTRLPRRPGRMPPSAPA